MNAVVNQLWAAARRSPLVAINLAVLLTLTVANYFLWQRHLLLSQQHAEARRNGETMYRSLKSQASASAELAKVQDALKFIDRNLVAEGDLAENLGYFYQLESTSHVRLSQLNQLSSQPPFDGSSYRAIPFSLRASGSYAEIMNFLRQMETGRRLLRVKSYSFGRGELASNALVLDLTVELLGNP